MSILDTPAPAVDTPAPTATETTPTTTTTTTTEGAGAIVTPDQSPTPAAPQSFPDNWRETLAAGDDKRLKQLQRYSDPLAFANKAWSLEAKLSSGEYKRDLPKNATPEQVKEWRQERGLPETHEGYQPQLPDGVVLGEADKPTMENFQKFAYENNLDPATFNKVLGFHYAEQDRINKMQETADVTYHEEAKDSLMAEWGLKDYRQNLASMAALRDQMPQGLADRILAGRTSDGKLVGDDPTFLRWFATLAREMNPTASIVGLEGGNTVESELDGIRKLRRENPDSYDKDKKLQARELELLTAKAKQKARG